MSPEAHPAVAKYLAALKAELEARPGTAAEEAFADAREFLDSEWRSLRRQAHFFSDHALYQHFVRKLGEPCALAAEYTPSDAPRFVADVAAAEPADNAPTATPARRRRRTLSYALFVAPLVIAVSAAALLRHGATSGGLASASAAAPASLDGLHWAERIASFVVGDPAGVRAAHPEAALGPPDCHDTVRESDRYVTLGASGELVVEFVERYLIDGPGVDLLVYELGIAEPYFVAVSEDGVDWVDIGAVAGSAGMLDLAVAGAPDRAYRFVRVRDALSGSDSYGGVSPGADVDAIGAIHSIPAR